jgi:hypothetical protein
MADELVLDENIIMNAAMAGDAHNGCNKVINELRGRLKVSMESHAEASRNLVKSSQAVRDMTPIMQYNEILKKDVENLREKLLKKDILEAACSGFRKVLTDYVRQQTENICVDPGCAICVQNRKDSVAAAMKALEVPVGHQMLNVFTAAQIFIDNVSMVAINSDGDEHCQACGGPIRDGNLKHRVHCEFKELRDAVEGTDTVGEKEKEEVPF